MVCKSNSRTSDVVISSFVFSCPFWFSLTFYDHGDTKIVSTPYIRSCKVPHIFTRAPTHFVIFHLVSALNVTFLFLHLAREVLSLTYFVTPLLFSSYLMQCLDDQHLDAPTSP